jgi:hypothetical protein
LCCRHAALFGCLDPALEANSGSYLADCEITKDINAEGLDADKTGRRALWEATEAAITAALAPKAN